MFQFEFSHAGEKYELEKAVVAARLDYGGTKTQMLDFLVDSGASRSLVGFSYVKDLIPPAQLGPEVVLAQDAQKNVIRGHLVDMDVVLVEAPELVVKVTMGVCKADVHSILGLTWFRKVRVHFHNFKDGDTPPRFYLERVMR